MDRCCGPLPTELTPGATSHYRFIVTYWSTVLKRSDTLQRANGADANDAMQRLKGKLPATIMCSPNPRPTRKSASSPPNGRADGGQLLRHPELLAGLFRHQQNNRSCIRQRRVFNARNAVSAAAVKYPQQSWGLDFVSPSKGQKTWVASRRRHRL